MSKSIKPRQIIIDGLPNGTRYECCDWHTRFTWALTMLMLLTDGLQNKTSRGLKNGKKNE